MRIEERQTVDIEFDRRPGMGLQKVGEIIQQPGFRQVVQVVIKIGADAPDGRGVGVDGFGAQALQALVLELAGILGLESRLGCCCHGNEISQGIVAMSPR